MVETYKKITDTFLKINTASTDFLMSQKSTAYRVFSKTTGTNIS